jgi:hypothetical protein
MNEQKKAYNSALRAARAAAKAALVLRTAIVAQNRNYRGPSLGKLESAVKTLGEVRRFATTD